MNDPNAAEIDRGNAAVNGARGRSHGREVSGDIIVVLAPHVAPDDDAKDLHDVAVRQGLVGLAKLLEALRYPLTRPLIISVERKKLRELERQAADGKRSIPSLTRFWRVEFHGIDEVPDVSQRLHELAARFERLPEVEAAYAELIAENPRVDARNDPLNRGQRYLDRAPRGIDARWAWTRRGGAGQGVGICVVEMEWVLHHEDIRNRKPTLICNENRASQPEHTGGHGTAVLGILSAEDNQLGIVGIASSLRDLWVASHFDGKKPGHVADAIMRALMFMSRGDILLIEVQRHGLPAEADFASCAAIDVACRNGVVVVEAAGNGNQDLDAVSGHGVSHINPGHASFIDPGAIIVGASKSAVAKKAHNRLDASNYGSRVNCYAWGENIVTSGGNGELAPPDTGPEVAYTAIFGGTSGAAAIIAGASAVTQGMHLAATGEVLSPTQMRTIMADPQLGTPHGARRPNAIGPMPDLRRIGTTAVKSTPLP